MAMKKVVAFLVLFSIIVAFVQAQVVTTVRDAQGGWELHVDGRRFFVKGVNWAINPPGTHGVWSLWNESEDTIRRVIDTEAQMMIAAGVNAIRVGPDIPARWVEHLYFMWGIHTIIHDVFGRWGVSVNGRYYRPTNFFLPHIREQLLRQSLEIVERYSGVRGVLMYMFGEANGDGLYWSGDDDQPDIIERFGTNPALRRGNALFSLLEEVFSAGKQIDPNRLFAFVNNDLGWLPVIASQVPSMDLLAVNMNRGIRAGPDFWREAAAGLDRPIVIASIGVDAWNSRLDREDQFHQAVYTIAQWEDIYANAYGHGASNSLGGVVNMWTDIWYLNDHYSWEFAGVQDTEAVFENSGFAFDHVPGQPNINPEWMGITAQGPRIVASNIRERLPRAAYFALQQIWSVNPWDLPPVPAQVTTTTTVNEDGETVTVTQTVPGAGVSPEFQAHFANIDLGLILARGLQDSAQPRPVAPFWGIRNSFTFTSMMTGHDVRGYLDNGGRIFDAFRDRPLPPAPGGTTSLPDSPVPVGHQFGAMLHSTFYGMADLRAGGQLEGEVTVAIRHDRGAPPQMEGGPSYGPIWSFVNRTPEMGLATRPFDLHSGWFRWTGFGAEVHGFYHTGRGGWMERGDFFNFALEAWGAPYVGDEWNFKAPLGAQFTHGFGLGPDQGLSVLAGPRLFEGASPMLIAMWNQDIARGGHTFRYSVAVSQELSSYDIQRSEFLWQEDAETRAALWFSWEPTLTDTSSLVVQAGVMGGNLQMLAGDPVPWQAPVNDTLSQGKIGLMDTLAFKARIEYSPIQHFGFLLEGIYAGLVANTNWHPNAIGTLLGDIGIGNRMEIKGGLTGSYGNFAIGLNALWRQPLAGPGGNYLNPAPGVMGNPFRVGENREALTLEFIFAFDMEPGSWIWWWNNVDTENSFFATTLVARYSIFEGATDPGFVDLGPVGGDGWNTVVDGSLAFMPYGFGRTYGNYSIDWRKFFNPNNDLRFVNTLSFTRGHPNNGHWFSPEERRETISGWSNTFQMRYRRFIAGATVVRNLWGTGYAMDHNMTHPWRWHTEFAFSFDPRPSLMTSANRIGIRWNGVTRDEHSHFYGILGAVDTNELVFFFNITF